MTASIPVFRLDRQIRSMRGEIDSAISDVLDQGNFILGKSVKRFEGLFARYVGAKHCVSVASGTDAIFLALKCLGIGPGDEVITVSNSASPTGLAVLYTGAVPVFVDVGGDYNIDPEKIESAVTEKTAAVLPVHLYGKPAAMERLSEIAGKHEMRVVEDCAQASGSRAGKHVGTFGDLGCFSFYPTKNLGAFGDGGAVVTDNTALADNLRSMRFYGQDGDHGSKFVGYNSRLDEIHAAVLEAKLKHLDRWNKARRNLAKIYDQEIAGAETPASSKSHVYHLYVIASDGRDRLRSHLEKSGIGTGIHYPVPMHRQTAFAQAKHGPLQQTEKNAARILSLPMYPELSEDEAGEVAKNVSGFFKG